MPDSAEDPSAWSAFRATVIRFDRAKLQPWIALRNTIGFGLLSCPDLIPDLWELVDAIHAKFALYTGSA